MSDSDYKRRYRCTYEYTHQFGRVRHTWYLIGGSGGLHLHITDYGEKHEAEYGERHLGGIEIHYRTPPRYMQDSPPSHDQCWLLHAPCWHDGSSLQASEKWIPLWRMSQHDHEQMFAMLAQYADYHFAVEAGGGGDG